MVSDMALKATVDINTAKISSDEVLDVLNGMESSIVCHNCGRELDDSIDGSNDSVLGVLRFDAGDIATPESPADPATYYFVCTECYTGGA